MKYLFLVAIIGTVTAFVVTAHATPCYFYPPNVWWCY